MGLVALWLVPSRPVSLLLACQLPFSTSPALPRRRQPARSRHSWGRLEFLIREDFERRNPDEALDDLKRRASFSKKDGALLRD
jgi:hypothetical protein